MCIRTHDSIKWNTVIREVIRFLCRNSKGVCVQSQTSNCNVVGDDVTCNCSSTVSNLEGLVGVDESARALRTKEVVCSLVISDFSNGIRLDEQREAVHLHNLHPL